MFCVAERLNGAKVEICSGSSCTTCVQSISGAGVGWVQLNCVGRGDSLKVSLQNQHLQICELVIYSGETKCE